MIAAVCPHRRLQPPRTVPRAAAPEPELLTRFNAVPRLVSCNAQGCVIALWLSAVQQPNFGSADSCVPYHLHVRCGSSNGPNAGARCHVAVNRENAAVRAGCCTLS